MKKVTLLFLLFSSLLVSPVQAQAPDSSPVVHAVLFWRNGCPACQYLQDVALPPLQKTYGDQLQIFKIEVATEEDYQLLVQVAEYYGSAGRGIPFLVIGDQVLIGTREIPDELPALIESYLAAGGVGYPDAPMLKDILPMEIEASEDLSQISNIQAPTSAETPEVPPAVERNNGFTLASIVMMLLAVSLVYSVISFAIGKSFSMPIWFDWFIPIIVVIGIGVAGYLSYIEVESAVAFCGPVGDCNSVQSSSYARLFGILPIGVLGLLGYLAMLVAWVVRRYVPTLKKMAAVSFFAMAFFAVVFSIYLTYLELFVIRAVCMWCLTSAVLVVVLLLLGLPSVVSMFSDVEELD